MAEFSAFLQQSRRAAGFSLVEAMIGVVLLGILVSLATPGYRAYQARAQRSLIIGEMLQVAACQERVFAAQRSYDTGTCLAGPGTHYRLEYTVPGVPDAGGWVLLARPMGTQAGDGCGYLSLDHFGTRAVGGESADVARCWSGR